MSTTRRCIIVVLIVSILLLIGVAQRGEPMTLETTYLQLGDLVLNDGKIYSVQDATFPPPELNRQWAGTNIFKDGTTLIESAFSNRVITLTLLLQADTEAGLRDALRDLYAEVYENTNVLEYRSPGSSESVYFDVFRGDVDVPAMPEGRWIRRVLDGVLVTLTAKPFARGDEVELKNLCKNASLDRDANGDGVPDFWGPGGTAVITVQVAYRKYGTGAAHLVGSADQDALSNNDVGEISVTAGETYAFSCWTWVRAGTLKIAIKRADNYEIIESTTTTADKWNRHSFTFVVPAGCSLIYVDFLQDGATALDAFVDGVYVGQHDEVPEGWSGYYILTNHTDDDAGDAGYLDVCDIPGDVPAQAVVRIHNTVSSVGRRLRWAIKQGDYADQFDHIWEMEDVALGTLDTKEVDATASGGYCWRYTPASPYDGKWYGTDNLWIIGQVAWGGTLEKQNIYEGAYYVYARIRVNDTQQYRIRMRPFIPNWWPDWKDDDEVTDFSMNEWGLVNLGKVDIPPISVPEGEYIDRLGLQFEVYAAAASGSLDIDYIWLVPVETIGMAEFDGYTMVGRHSISTMEDELIAYMQMVTLPRAAGSAGMRYVGYYPYLGPNTRAKLMISIDRRKLLDYSNEDCRDFEKGLWEGDAIKWLGQKFECEAACSPKVIWLYLRRAGSASSDMYLEIQTDAGGKPSGSTVANGTSGAVAMSGVGTDYSWTAFVYATAPSLAAATPYHFVLKSSQGAADPDNLIWWGQDLVGSYPDGFAEQYDDISGWQTLDWSYRDFLFKASIDYNLLGETFDVIIEYRPRYLLVP